LARKVRHRRAAALVGQSQPTRPFPETIKRGVVLSVVVGIGMLSLSLLRNRLYQPLALKVVEVKRSRTIS
jgi:hypothetical protein